MDLLKILPEKYSGKANEIIDSKENINKFLSSTKLKIQGKKIAPLLEKWELFKEYLFSSDVPVKNKLKIISGVLYLISPVSLPTAIDEVLVLGWLLPYILQELDTFAKGEYTMKKVESQGTEKSFQNPFLDIEDDKSNPFLKI